MVRVEVWARFVSGSGSRCGSKCVGLTGPGVALGLARNLVVWVWGLGLNLGGNMDLGLGLDLALALALGLIK